MNGIKCITTMINYLVLRPEDLLREDVLRAACEGKIVMMVEENGPEKKALIDQVMKELKACQRMITPSYSMRNVRVHLNYIADNDWEFFSRQMHCDASRKKYLCHIVGGLLEEGLLCGTPGELAPLLRMRLSLESRRRYIYEGKSLWQQKRKFFQPSQISQIITVTFAASSLKY